MSAEGTANVPGAEGELPHLPALLERLRALPGIRSAGFVSKTQTLLDLDDSSVATWAKESLWRPEGNLPDAAGDDVFGTVYYVDDVTWELLLGEAGAEKDAQGCVVVNEVLDSGHEGQQPFGDALLGTRLSLSGTEVSWEVVGLLDEVPGWFWLSRGELESVLPTVLAPASSVAGADREDIGYGMTTLYATADDSSAAAADVDRLLEENPALATWDGVVDERAEAHRSEALYGAIRALLSTFGVAAAAVGVASAFNSSAASVLLRAHDFAVLRSVGMGERDLRRMPALECARTAAWGLALGLAAALALGAWIGTQGGLTMRSLGLEAPWHWWRSPFSPAAPTRCAACGPHRSSTPSARSSSPPPRGRQRAALFGFGFAAGTSRVSAAEHFQRFRRQYACGLLSLAPRGPHDEPKSVGGLSVECRVFGKTGQRSTLTAMLPLDTARTASLSRLS